MKQALQGIKIVDLTTTIAGPLTFRTLADYGADVIKIESPDGDPTRSTGPRKVPRLGAVFIQLNRNKRSVSVNLKSSAGKEVIRRLIADADVFGHNMRPSALARLGLDYDACRTINPKIIHAGIVGYGRDGRNRDAAAYDDLIQAASGVTDLVATATQGSPGYTPLNLADRLAGLTAVHAVLAALIHRGRTGEGQSIEIPMFETVVEFLMGDHMWGATFDQSPASMGYSRALSPNRGPYQTSDGYIAVLPYINKHWHALYRLLGKDDYITDPRFATTAGRFQNMDLLLETTLQGGLRGKTTAEWTELMRAADIPCGTVNRLGDLLTDPHLQDVGLFQTYTHPTEGELTVPRPPVWMSETPPQIRTQPSLLGEDNADVLHELGFTDAEIDQMRADGVLHSAS